MHFSIPDTVQETDENGSKYWNFLIHINGVFHCKLRYSQLDKLYEQLRNDFPHRTPSRSFPGKKLFTLTLDQLEKRREGLESFIQNISQDPVISSSKQFNEFFLNAQHVGREDPEDVKLNIYLMNGNKVTVDVSSIDQTDDVYEATLKKIGLNLKFFHYFALFLIQQDSDEKIKIVRKLQEFESPYMSLQAVDQPHKIVIRKNYCNPKYDNDIIDDRVAMNLLYVQIADDLDRGWMICSEEIRKKLKELQAEKSRKKFLNFAKRCRYYGFTHYTQCIADYPEENCHVLVCSGDREITTRVVTCDRNVLETCFKVQRIRSWRLTSVPYTENCHSKTKETLYFAFEYLFAKDDLRWITIKSEQAIMMSMAMQSMVDEILQEQVGKGIRQYSQGKRRNSSSSDPHNPAKPDSSKNSAKEYKPFAQSNKSNTFSFKSKKDNVNKVYADAIGDDDL